MVIKYSFIYQLSLIFGGLYESVSQKFEIGKAECREKVLTTKNETMKLLITLSTLFISIICNSQNTVIPYKDNVINYSEVVNLDSSYKKNDLYISAKRFFVDAFNSGKDVIQLDDKDAGLVVGKGFFSVIWKANFMYSYDMQVYHIIKVYVKDGKYKFEITDFSYKYFISSSQYMAGGWQEGSLNHWKGHNEDKVFNQIDKEVKNEIIKLKNTMKNKNYSSDF